MKKVCSYKDLMCCVLRPSVVSDSLQPHELKPTRLFCPWNFPSKNTGVDCHFLLQGIFLNQGINMRLLCLLHWQAEKLDKYYQISFNKHHTNVHLHE